MLNVAVGANNLRAVQARMSTLTKAEEAIALFGEDAKLTRVRFLPFRFSLWTSEVKLIAPSVSTFRNITLSTVGSGTSSSYFRATVSRLVQALAHLLFSSFFSMMDQPHLGQWGWQQNMINTLPAINYVQSTESTLPGPLRVSVQGSLGVWPGDALNRQFFMHYSFHTSLTNHLQYLESFQNVLGGELRELN